MRWIAWFAFLGIATYMGARWMLKPAIDIDTFVETPEVYERLEKKWDGVVSNTMRVTPRVDVNAPESVIKWPAYKSKIVAAPAVELRIRKQQWSATYPMADRGFIGPSYVSLKLNWPEEEESRAKARANEEPPRLIYSRSGEETNDLLYSERYRASSGIKYASPMDAPREEAVVASCNRSLGCEIRFEHLGRPAQLSIPARRGDDWEAAYMGARRLLASITTPIARK